MAGYKTKSNTPHQLTTGEKTFIVTTPNLDYKKDDNIWIIDRNRPTIVFLQGKVISYNTGTNSITVNVIQTYGVNIVKTAFVNTWDIDNKNYVLSTEGANLLASINLNLNPLDIEEVNGLPPGFVSFKWNKFIEWYYSSNNTIKLVIDNNASNDNKTNILINNFNNYIQSLSPPPFPLIYNGNSTLLNVNDVKAVQRFHSKTDSNVLVDEGFIGTQTIRLSYPKFGNSPIPLNPYTNANKNDRVFYPTTPNGIGLTIAQQVAQQRLAKKYNEGKIDYIPWPSDAVAAIIWGNKRFILEQQYIGVTPDYLVPNFFKSYDLEPTLYKDRLIFNSLNAKYTALNYNSYNSVVEPYNVSWEDLGRGNLLPVIDADRYNDDTKDFYDKTIDNLSQQTKLLNNLIR
jgi:hypothetical protein